MSHSLLFIVLLAEREIEEHDIYHWPSSLGFSLPYLAYVPNIFNSYPKLYMNLIQTIFSSTSHWPQTFGGTSESSLSFLQWNSSGMQTGKLQRGLDSERPWSESRFCPLPPVWPWTNYLNVSESQFPQCKIKVIASTPQAAVRIK